MGKWNETTSQHKIAQWELIFDLVELRKWELILQMPLAPKEGTKLARPNTITRASRSTMQNSLELERVQ